MLVKISNDIDFFNDFLSVSAKIYITPIDLELRLHYIGDYTQVQRFCYSWVTKHSELYIFYEGKYKTESDIYSKGGSLLLSLVNEGLCLLSENQVKFIRKKIFMANNIIQRKGENKLKVIEANKKTVIKAIEKRRLREEFLLANKKQRDTRKELKCTLQQSVN